MNCIEIKNIVENWFRLNHSCGIILPKGWFGRPGDSFWELEKCECENKRLCLYLESERTLVLEDARLVFEEKKELVFQNFSELVFTWKSLPNGETVTEKYFEGELRLVSSLDG